MILVKLFYYVYLVDVFIIYFMDYCTSIVHISKVVFYRIIGSYVNGSVNNLKYDLEFVVISSLTNNILKNNIVLSSCR